VIVAFLAATSGFVGSEAAGPLPAYGIRQTTFWNIDMSNWEMSKPRNHLLQALGPRDLDMLSGELEYVWFKRGDMLVSPNEPISYVYFPTAGICSIVALASGSNRIEAGVVGREGLVGLAALLSTDCTPHQCIVQVDGEGFRIGAERLRGLMQLNSRLREVLLRYVQVVLIQAEQTALANGRFSIERRLARWILMCHDRIDGDELNFTHELLSTMLGVRRPGVTVATHVLEGTKMIRATRGRLAVLNREKLEEAAGGSYGIPEAEYERLIGPFRAEQADMLTTTVRMTRIAPDIPRAPYPHVS
jgi:CRP-like cAMP-binding protein